MTAVYEKSFDANEWFVIIGFILFNLIVWLVPKIFSKLEIMAYYVYGIFAVMFYDHSVAVAPWNYYDVNDASSYQFMDFIYYLMNGPISYFFIFFYSKFQIKGHLNILYIFIWSIISLIIEWFGVKIGLFHYNHGYKIYWSFPIYIMVQTLLINFHHLLKRKKDYSQVR